MAIVIRFSPASMTAALYDEAFSRIKETGVLPAAGRLDHLVFGTADQLQVLDVWESMEHLTEFAKVLGPILKDVGIEPGEPEIHELYSRTLS